MVLTVVAVFGVAVAAASLPAAEEEESSAELPAEYAARYVVASETVSPDEKLAIIVPKDDPEEFPEGKNYVVALQPFAVLGALETRWPQFIGRNHGGISAEWSKDSSVALVTLESKWGPGDIFLIETRDGKLSRVTNMLAKARELLLPNYRSAKPKPEPYNDLFDFIFESEEDKPVCRLEGTRRVIVDAHATTDPKGVADRPWRAHLAATWDIAQGKFTEQRITRPRRSR